MYDMRYFQVQDKQIEYWEAVSNPRDSVFRWLAKQREHANGLILYILPFSGLKCRWGEACGCAEDKSSGSSQFQQELQDWREVFQIVSAVPELRLCVLLPQNVKYGCLGVVACLKECLEEHCKLIWQVRTALDYRLRAFTGETHKPQTIFVDVLVQLVPSSIRSLEYIVPHSCTSIGALSALTGLTQITLRSETYEPPETLWDVWETLAALADLRDLTCEGMSSHGLLSSVLELTRLTALRITTCGARNAGGVFGGSLTSLSTLQQLEVLHLKGEEVCGSLTSLEGLLGLSRLRDLSLKSCTDLVSLEGISPAAVASETELGLDAAKAVSTSLAGSKQQAPLPLQELRLCMCPRITSLAPLAGLSSSLRVMSLVGCEHLSSLEGIEEALSLQELCVHFCPISSLAPLIGLSRLRVLHTDCCCDQLRSSLAGDEQVPPSLQELALYSGSVTSLSSLSGLGGLQVLSLHGCDQLTSLKGIESAPLLQELQLNSCPGITLLAPLSGLSSLQELSLVSCRQLSSLAGIEQSLSLRQLTVDDCPVTLEGQVDKKALVKRFPILKYYVSVGDILYWELLDKLGWMAWQLTKYVRGLAVGLLAVVVGLGAALYRRLLRPL
jgi:hypothetical protein